MSVDISSAVWKHSQQVGGARLVMLSLADRADNDGYCWPGLQDIADRTKLSTRHVSRIINDANKAGELYVHRRTGDTNQYIVIVGMTKEQALNSILKRFPEVEKEEIITWLEGIDTMSPPTPMSRGIDTHVQGGWTPMSTEPSITVNETSKTLKPLTAFVEAFGKLKNSDQAWALENIISLYGEAVYYQVLEWSKTKKYKHLDSRIRAMETAAAGWELEQEETEIGEIGGRLV